MASLFSSAVHPSVGTESSVSVWCVCVCLCVCVFVCLCQCLVCVVAAAAALLFAYSRETAIASEGKREKSRNGNGSKTNKPENTHDLTTTATTTIILKESTTIATTSTATGTMTTKQSTSPAQDWTVVQDKRLLQQYGVCVVKAPFEKDKCLELAKEYSTPLPPNFDDGEDAFYRNIREDPAFSFDQILGPTSAIATAMKNQFGVTDPSQDMVLDDAFCVYYNSAEHDNTAGAKHQDPSDITVNLCLEKEESVEGSQVLFYGTQQLQNTTTTTTTTTSSADGDSHLRFAVDAEPGYATVHWGHHPHETLAMTGSGGRRTNIILTYCFKKNSKAMNRTCY